LCNTGEQPSLPDDCVPVNDRLSPTLLSLLAPLALGSLLACAASRLHAAEDATAVSGGAPTPAAPSTAAVNSSVDTPSAATASDVSSGFEMGGGSPWRFVPQLTVIGTYDDNLFITPTNKVSDTYLQVAPALAVGLGDFRSQVSPFAPIPHMLAQTGEEDITRSNFLYFNYTPDFEEFFHQHREDTVNQDARFAGQEEGERWKLQGSFHYQDVTDPNIYLGGRDKQVYINTNVDGSYELTGKLTAGLHLEGDRSDITGGYSQQQGIVTGYLDFQATEKTSLGLGLAAGELQVASDPDQVYLQTLLRYRYQATEKIWLTGNVGADFRELRQGGGDRTSLIFDLNAEYAATESTTVTLTARRATVGAIEYRGVDIWESIYQAAIRQRIGNGFIATGSVGMVWDDYRPFASDVVLLDEMKMVPPRTDKFYFYKVALGHDLTRHGTVQVAFEHREDASTIEQYSFTDNLLSLNLSFLF